MRPAFVEEVKVGAVVLFGDLDIGDGTSGADGDAQRLGKVFMPCFTAFFMMVFKVSDCKQKTDTSSCTAFPGLYIVDFIIIPCAQKTKCAVKIWV